MKSRVRDPYARFRGRTGDSNLAVSLLPDLTRVEIGDNILGPTRSWFVRSASDLDSDQQSDLILFSAIRSETQKAVSDLHPIRLRSVVAVLGQRPLFDAALSDLK